MQEWDDVAKAQWILENGPVPEIVWIFERVGDQVYKRPSTGCKHLPPWINTQRQKVLAYTTGYNIEHFAFTRQ